MDWFYWLFPPIMTALPLAMVWGSDYILPPAPKTSFRRWGLLLLPIAIAAIIAAYLSALAAFGNVRWVTHGLAYLYFPVWGFAMALTIRPDPDFGERNLRRVERTASLTPRIKTSPVTPAWWIAAWGMTVVGVALLVVAALATAPSVLMIIILVAVSAVFSLGLTHWTLPRTLEEPEPLAADSNPLLKDEYERFRNQRAKTFFALFGIGMPCLLLLFGAGFVWAAGSAASGSTLGIIGGVAGSLFGLIGAAFGVSADLKRKRLREMLHQTEGR